MQEGYYQRNNGGLERGREGGKERGREGGKGGRKGGRMGAGGRERMRATYYQRNNGRLGGGRRGEREGGREGGWVQVDSRRKEGESALLPTGGLGGREGEGVGGCMGCVRDQSGCL